MLYSGTHMTTEGVKGLTVCQPLNAQSYNGVYTAADECAPFFFLFEKKIDFQKKQILQKLRVYFRW